MKHENLRSTAAMTALICGLIATPLVGAEVYRWTDENGVTHFSQTPPPAGQQAEVQEIPETAAVEGEDRAAGIDFDGTAAVPPSAADERRQELAEAGERQRAEQAERETLCAQASTRLAQVEPSRRVYYSNEEGETVRMDDEARVAEVEQLRDFLARNCT